MTIEMLIFLGFYGSQQQMQPLQPHLKQQTAETGRIGLVSRPLTATSRRGGWGWGFAAHKGLGNNESHYVQ